jgi:hypothetical protein
VLCYGAVAGKWGLCGYAAYDEPLGVFDSVFTAVVLVFDYRPWHVVRAGKVCGSPILVQGMAKTDGSSPWWLVRQGRLEDAEEALKKLSSEKVNVKASLAQIVETDTLERDMEAGSTYYDVFRKINWRRTEIAIGVYTTQVLCGVYLINYGTYFFGLAGLGTDQAFNM